MIDVIVTDHEPENVPLGERVQARAIARALTEAGLRVRTVVVFNAQSGNTSQSTTDEGVWSK